MSAGALAARLTLDASGFKAEMMGASSVSERELKRIQRQVQFVNDYIKETAKVQREAGAASSELAKATHGVEGFSFATSGAKRELLVLAHELSQGNYSRFGGSMLVLGERTGAAALLFSGLGIASLAAAAALGAFALAAFKGHAELDAFNKSLQLTGNFAGLTASSFESLAASTAKAASASIGSSKDGLQALVSTGRISQESIGAANVALLGMEKLSGQSADEIAKDFAKMGDGVAKWAQTHNAQYHYLSAAQFTYIKALEDQGKKEQAEAENFRLLGEHSKTVVTNLGLLESAWKTLGEVASKTWQAMLGIGKADTTQQQIAGLQKLLDQTQGQQSLHMGDKSVQNMRQVTIDNLKQQIYLLQEKARLEQRSADAQSAQAVKDQAAIAKIMTPGKKAKDADPLGAIRTGQEQVKNDFLRTEIASYDELAKAMAKAAQEQAKLQAEQDKSFNDWFQKFNEKDMAKNMPFGEATADAIGKYLRDIGDQTKAAEQLVSGAFGRMEDAIVQFTHTGKLSFKDVFTFMADEWLRNQIRMQEKKLLDSAGNFDWGKAVAGVGSALSGIGGAVSGWFSHENGMASVPYDGYPALLHKGERVMTRQDSVRASSGGAVHIDNSGAVYNVGQGVSRGEMAAAVQEGNAKTEARIRRLTRNGNI